MSLSPDLHQSIRFGFKLQTALSGSAQSFLPNFRFLAMSSHIGESYLRSTLLKFQWFSRIRSFAICLWQIWSCWVCDGSSFRRSPPPRVWRNSEKDQGGWDTHRVFLCLHPITFLVSYTIPRDVADITKAPEMLGGRVKTLHPAVHGGKFGKIRNNILPLTKWLYRYPRSFYPFWSARLASPIHFCNLHRCVQPLPLHFHHI